MIYLQIITRTGKQKKYQQILITNIDFFYQMNT